MRQWNVTSVFVHKFICIPRCYFSIALFKVKLMTKYISREIIVVLYYHNRISIDLQVFKTFKTHISSVLEQQDFSETMLGWIWYNLVLNYIVMYDDIEINFLLWTIRYYWIWNFKTTNPSHALRCLLIGSHILLLFSLSIKQNTYTLVKFFHLSDTFYWCVINGFWSIDDVQSYWLH